MQIQRRLAAILGLVAGIWATAVMAQAPAAAPGGADPLAGAEIVGSNGRMTVYRQGASVLLALPAAALGQPLLWYTEVVGMPAGGVARNGLEVNSALVRFERQGGLVHVRDLSTVNQRRPAPVAGGVDRVPGAAPGDPKRRPIEVALDTLNLGPLVTTFGIVGAKPDGGLLIDLTPAFSSDIPVATGRLVVAQQGVMPAAVDPLRSYIERVRLTERSLNIRSHLTFVSGVPAMPAVGPQLVSVVLGHSLVFLPEQPMRPRPEDPRVGYFSTRFQQFDSLNGPAQATQSHIVRFRLEKANPRAAVSDPVKPITYYLGPGIPARWKPYIAAGVLQWLPVFEAAGLSNAIRVLDAPTPAQDPNWTPEDVTINVIRWVPQEFANAMGPHVVDPRSGETLAAHIQIWPQVLDFFGQYYWAMFGGGVDPEARSLPLSTEKTGALLSYIVAHEVGHTLGLAHNQIASTAYGVAQLRDPAFANRAGPNSSIMAYGRFNQAAQPGDGVTRLWGVPGPYDHAAIRYGYGDFGADPAAERRALAAFASSFARDRRLFFGSEEGGPNVSRFGRDPRVQMENVGAERVRATRLGVANLLRSLDRLDTATGGDAGLYASTYGVLLGRQVGLLKSVHRLIGAAQPPLGDGDGPLAALVPAAEQREAVAYLLGDGARSLEPYAVPAVVERVAVFGGYRAIDRLQAELVKDLLTGPNVAALESQKRRDPAAYGPTDLGRDASAAVWGELARTSPTRRALQRGWLEASRSLLEAWAQGRGAQEAAEARAVVAAEVTNAAARALLESGDDTLFISWLRADLAHLRPRLEALATGGRDDTERLHYADMAAVTARLLQLAAR